MRGIRGRLLAGVTVVAIAVGAIWWWRTRTPALAAAPAHIALMWRGGQSGRMTLPARLRWCPVTRIGLLEGVSGDSGVLVVLYETNAITSGRRAVVSPDVVASSAKPVASAAFRWMRLDTDSVLEQFRAQSGSVRLQLAGGRVSGEINVRMHGPVGTPPADTLVLRAVFRDVPLVTTAAGCS